MFQLRAGDFDPFGENEGALKLACGDAAMKERFAVCLNLLAADQELAALNGDVQLFLREARDGQRDAKKVFARLLDVVGRIPISGALGGTLQQPFQVLEAQEKRAVEIDGSVHLKALLSSGFG